MPDSKGTRKPRQQRPPSPPRKRGPSQVGSAGVPMTFRERLRRDRFLFAMCLGFLAFTTWALAVSWRLFGDPVLLAFTVASVLPAFYLFYLRDGSAPTT